MYTTIDPSQRFYPPKSAGIYFFLCALMLLFSCHTTPVKRYGFLTMLGHDTISVETIIRQGNMLDGDEVDRFPQVQIRHTVIKLNDDGSIRHLVMEIHTPSELSGKRDRTVVAEVGHNNVHL